VATSLVQFSTRAHIGIAGCAPYDLLRHAFDFLSDAFDLLLG
jgi:hypothetical protein